MKLRLLNVAFLFMVSAAPAAEPERIIATPALWEVKGPHTEVYLLGSVHAMKKGVEWFVPPIRERFEKATDAWFEIKNLDNQEDTKAAVQKYCMLPTPEMTKGLTDEESKALFKHSKAGFFDIISMMSMKKSLVTAWLAIAQIKEIQYEPALGIDTVLRGKAKKGFKRLRGFETMEEQTRFICMENEAESTAALKQAIANYDQNLNMSKDMFKHWIKGDEAALTAMIDAEFKQITPEYYSRLILERNRNWQPQIEKMIGGKDPVFITVGAAHLVGPDGIIAVLKNKGYDVQRVPTTTSSAEAAPDKSRPVPLKPVPLKPH